MSDLIKREDAIKALLLNHKDVIYIDKNECAKRIEAIPSADRPKGKWIEDYNGNGWNDYWDYTCSNCGKRYERADAVLCKANFCPNCGARMKGADDETD